MDRWRSSAAGSLDGWLGIETQKSDRGDLTVTKVLPGGPAEKAGIQPNDILTSVNGVSFVASERPALAALIDHGFAEGKQVTVTVLREGKVTPLDVTLGTPPGKTPMAPPSGSEQSQPAPMGH